MGPPLTNTTTLAPFKGFTKPLAFVTVTVMYGSDTMGPAWPLSAASSDSSMVMPLGQLTMLPDEAVARLSPACHPLGRCRRDQHHRPE